MKTKYFLFTALIAGTSFQGLQAQSLDNIFRKFSQCDAAFFRAMKDESQTVQTLGPTDSRADALWIKVADRNDEKNRSITLSGSPTIGGLPVASYLDEASDLGDLGRFYYWGFKIKGSQAEVLEKLRPLVYESNRLRKDAPVYVRTELNINGTRWLPVRTASGVPKEGTVERAFLFEEDDQDKNITKVFCSLQGSIRPEHLKELRPDIDEKDYPVIPKPIAFEDASPAPDLMTRLQGSLGEQPLFMPKFKRAIIDYKTVSSKSSVAQTDTLVHQGNGVIDLHEDLTFMGFKRQTVGGLIQTKYAYIKPGGKIFRGVHVARQGTIEVAKVLTKGELAFRSSVTSVNEPADASDKPTTSTRSCTVGDTIAASTILQSLTGNAVLMNCVFGGEKPETAGFALVSDLGLLLQYELPDTRREYKPVYTRITIER